MTSPRSRPRTVCYLAETDAAARHGAAALEDVPSGADRTVQPLATDAIERLRSWAPEADCVVFAETPTTAAGATLLEVLEACGSTPLVLFTDATFAPAAARSTDGIDGYVRRDTEDAVAHLADEIDWVCGGVGTDTGRSETEPELEGEADTGTDTDTAADANADTGTATDTDVVAMPGEQAPATPSPAERLLESIPELAARRDRDRLFELLVATAADALEYEACWLSTVQFGAFEPRATAPAVAAADLESTPREGPLGDALRTGEPVLIDDLADDDRLDAPLAGVRSLCCLPVGDAGLLQVAAAAPGAFDEREFDALAAWCRIGTAVLERTDADAERSTERDHLRRELDRVNALRDRLADERDELAAERDGLADERDHLRSLFSSLPEPAIRYEIDDGRPIVRDVTEAFTEIFDTDREAVVDAPLDEDTVPPGLEHRQTALIEALRTGERRRLASRRETADGVREFRLTVVPLESAGHGPGIEHDPEGLLVYSDVTETNRRERELAATEERLETIAELLDEDVRTPLNVARGYLELADATGDAEHFQEVDDAQEELRELVDGLVAIARRDEVIVETEPVAVHDVARRAWVTVETGDARLVTAPADDRVLEADKTRLQELFEQLFRATLEKASADDRDSDGETRSDDDAGTRPDDDPPIVTVGATDGGFYVTGHRAGDDGSISQQGTTPVPGRLAAADGTGFGLGPVERIADAHGWDVSVAEDEAGTSFVFRGVDSAGVGGN